MSEREKEQNTNSIERSRSNKGQEHNHNREVIFALPSLRLHFKSEHLQGATTPDTTSGKIMNRKWRAISFLILGNSFLFVQKNHQSNAVSLRSLKIISL